MLAPLWVSFVLTERRDIVVALDWTDFDGDEQTTLVLNIITTHGWATPLLWKTVKKQGLKTRRNDDEDDLFRRLRDAVPDDVRVTVLAVHQELRPGPSEELTGRRHELIDSLAPGRPLGSNHPAAWTGSDNVREIDP